ncbi:MAG TPA: hypothetical protein VMZ91_14760 [Candidatus Paceibacterota bacterium]|nr:hypothetical protein [Candidatus Paceibacterota bacterium]
MNLKNFINWCNGDLMAVEKAIKLMANNEIDFENFTSAFHYFNGNWEIDKP